MQPSDIISLIDKFVDGTSSPEQASQLKELLRSRPDVQMEYFKRLDLHATILLNQPTITAAPCPEDLRLLEEQTCSKRPSARLPLVATALFAMLLVGMITYSVVSPADVATITQLGEHAQFEDQHFTVNSQLALGQEVSLKQGLVEMELASGVRIVIEGPALFVLLRPGMVQLHFGSLFAHVPKKATGFIVETPASRIVDLGTRFGVVVNKTGATEVHVIQGRVEAGLLDNSGQVIRTQQLAANNAARFQKEEQSITKINIRAEYFARNAFEGSNSFSLRRKYGITQHSATVVIQEKIPAFLIERKAQYFENDDQVFVFPEKEGILLKNDLPVEISRPGSSQAVNNPPQENDFIPAGTTVDCFRFHYDPTDKAQGRFIPVQGEIHFDRPVLGIIFSGEKVLKTDVWFHPLLQGKPEKTANTWGIELEDEIILSEDRKSLSFSLSTRGVGDDEFRVLVESQKALSH